MKTGASTLAIANEKFGENLGFYEDLDLKYIEIIDQYPNIDDNADLLNSFNFKYTVHSPILDINIASLNEAIRQTSINEIKKSMDLATKINADLVVVHPGNVPFMGRGLEDLISEKMGINTMTAEEPMTAVAIGTGKCVEFRAGYREDF